MEGGSIIIVAVIFGILVFAIAILITRTIFRINTIVKNLQAQTELLSLIAHKNGVDTDRINSISATVGGKAYKLKLSQPTNNDPLSK